MLINARWAPTTSPQQLTRYSVAAVLKELLFGPYHDRRDCCAYRLDQGFAVSSVNPTHNW